MRVLVLGGSNFVGRCFVEAALARGWSTTVFNRGGSPVPAGVERLRGDRLAADGLAELEHGEWDIVVDTWLGAPTAVRDATRLLADRTGHYVYVSSRSVHPLPMPPDSDESAPTVPASPDDVDVEYAQAKRGGELAAAAAYGERALFARAGLVIGPYENVGRLPWWLRRTARGGLIPAPGPADLGLQYIDARDLAEWSLDAAVRGLHGPYNVVSPPGFTTMRDLLETCIAVTGASAELRWIDPERIQAAGVRPWTELPIWLPPGELHDSLHRADVSRAMAAGLRCRPVTETVADTWAWLRDLDGAPPSRPDLPPVGLTADAEQRLLAV